MRVRAKYFEPESKEARQVEVEIIRPPSNIPEHFAPVWFKIGDTTFEMDLGKVKAALRLIDEEASHVAVSH